MSAVTNSKILSCLCFRRNLSKSCLCFRRKFSNSCLCFRKFVLFFFSVWQCGQRIITIEVKAGTNSHLRSLHSFINNSQNTNIAVRVWSGEYFVQETKTPAPFNKPFRLINLPFYLVGSIDKIVEEEILLDLY